MSAWSAVEIGGKPAEVFEPTRRRYGVIYLHGVGRESLTDKVKFTNLFEELGLACVRPEGGQSWWCDRLCLEFDGAITAERYVTDVVLPWARQRWALPERAVGLFGVSMGGQGALRLAFKKPALFPAVAAIAPAIEYHQLIGQGAVLDDMYESREQCRQDTAPMHVDPHEQPRHIFFCCDPDDDWHRGCDRLHEKLSALGIAHECDLASRGGGHSWAYYNSMADRALRFLVTGLEHESRRLL